MGKATGSTKADFIRDSGIDNELLGTRVLEVMKSAPVPLGTLIPTGWIISEKGVFQRKFSKNGEELEPNLISYEPIVISSIFQNLTDESEGFIVSWFNGYEWKEVAYSRDYFASSNKIIELSYLGFPVNSNNIKNLIQYITDFYAVNRPRLPIKRYSEQLGWIKEGFLLGNQYVALDGKEISFYPVDVGEKQLVEGIHAKGDIESWLNIIRSLTEYPNVIIGVYASLGSALCSILKVPGFILEWSSETSKGKTVSLKAAASVWGNPTTDQNGIIKKWNLTPVNIERSASLLKNIPLFLDDTKDLSRTKVVSNLVYNLASGQGKGRGSVKGSQKIRYWNNITFSTGEQKITTFTKDGGTAARVIPLTGLPYGKADNETAELVEAIQMDMQDHYGVAGERWIRYILENKKCWNDWKNLYRIYTKMFAQQANGNSVVGRLAKYMALIATSANLFNDCFEMEYDFLGIIGAVWQQIIEENGEVDRPLQAMKAVLEWTMANQGKFDNSLFNNGSFGIWNSKDHWHEILFYPTAISDYLKSKGYEPTSIIKSWFERDWLNVTKSRGYKKQKKLNGIQMDFISIKREALEQ